MDAQIQVKELLRGTTHIISEAELLNKLREDRPLFIKFGVDPTSPNIHLGHIVPLQKLRQFQKFGHSVQVVIGDYTAMIGDPSGKSETRPMLTKKEIEQNLNTYTSQLFKILDPDRTEIVYNSAWLGSFSGSDIIKLSSRYTVQQLLRRRDFAKRLTEDKPLSVSELLYPLLVGYDSVHLHSDVEVGGTDQLFNFIASRDIQKSYGQKEEVVITLPVLEGVDGKRKMSKSYGNSIDVNDNPHNMYGKIMSISDQLMLKYYELLSDISVLELDKIKADIREGRINPLIYKQGLAAEIVSKYHGKESAAKAEEYFNMVHRDRGVPKEIMERRISYNSDADLSLIKILRRVDKASSNSEARRLITQGGIRVDGEVIHDVDYKFTSTAEPILQTGKNFVVKLKFIR